MMPADMSMDTHGHVASALLGTYWRDYGKPQSIPYGSLVESTGADAMCFSHLWPSMEATVRQRRL